MILQGRTMEQDKVHEFFSQEYDISAGKHRCPVDLTIGKYPPPLMFSD